MNSADNLWRRHLRRWMPPLVLALVFGCGLLVYGLVFAKEAQRATQGLGRNSTRAAQLESRRQTLGEQAGRLKKTRHALASFYGETIGTEREKLTKVIAEVKRLAVNTGLALGQVSYPQEELEDYGLVKMSFVFSVNGSYVQLRRFINLLELSDMFLTLEEVRLTESGDKAAGGLRISLRLSTLFERESNAGRDEA